MENLTSDCQSGKGIGTVNAPQVPVTAQVPQDRAAFLLALWDSLDWQGRGLLVDGMDGGDCRALSWAMDKRNKAAA